MPYNSQDKYEMALRQARVDIGQGRGNAMTNAVNIVLSKPTLNRTTEEILFDVFEISDKIFHYSQVKIDTDYKAWFEANDHQLKLDTGLEVPTINEEAM